MAKILGLDLGTNSVGWAVVDKEKGEEFNLLEKGVRIFQEGVKIEKGVEGSKAAERTGYRSARRIKYRRKVRKVNTLKVLSDYGYCPGLDKEELKNWLYKKIYPQNELFNDWWKTDDKTNKNPYYFRNLAVTEKLDVIKEENRFTIGRAFYHMAQRRGFLSNRLEGTKESEGAVKRSIAEISEAKGEKTLGQYFYEKYRNGEKIRDTYTHRDEHYLEEFERICAFQNLPSDFVEKLRKAIFYQRPLKSQKGLIGNCVFESNKPRCAVSRPEFEEYRMLCFVNNIKIKTPEDEKLRFLTSDEKEKIKPQFYRKSKEHFDFEDLAKQLAPKKQYKYYRSQDNNQEDWLFNYGMKTTVSGCPVSSRFIELFGEDFHKLKLEYIRETDGKPSTIDISDVWHVLYSFDSDEKLAEFAHKRLGFDDARVKEFLKIRLKQDYASLSLKAIRKILPYLRKGLIYSHAVFLANMEEIIPKDIWQDKNNRDYIRDEIKLLIDTQNEEKQIIDIVNGVVKSARNEDNGFVWSHEASELFRNDLNQKIKSHFGSKRYAEFSEEKKTRIETNAFELLKKQMQKNMGRGEYAMVSRIDDRVLGFISDNFGVTEEQLEKIYHPSAIDIYKPPVKGKDGRYYLGSPMVSSIRNPMAMRAIHQLRKVINELIKEDIVDANTKIHIEMSRGLLNANERKATQNWQRDNETKRKEYAAKIKEFLNGGEPSEEEILKYQLWEEQRHKCLYTGQEIRISDFLGADPKFDIEHTIPRSLSFDNSQTNKTLCDNSFNRSIKRNKIPSQLANHAEILERIEFWREKYIDLNDQINRADYQVKKNSGNKEQKDKYIRIRHELRFQRDYWRNKYQRFTMEDVPDGFKNSQLVDTGIITKYSRMYLKTYFDKVYTVKGNTVADFRRLWGIQDEYDKKERVNHIHHCIDAISIACITKEQYENLAKFYHDWEDLHVKGVDHLPPVEKPWATFPEDVKKVENEVLVSHYTPDVLPKQSKNKLRKRGKIQYNKQGDPIYQQGDTVRGSLHKETNYGAIKRPELNKKGELEEKLVYAVRKPVDSLTAADIKNIVDNSIRKIVENDKKEEIRLKKELANAEKRLKDAEEQEEITNVQIEVNSLKELIAGLFVIKNKDGSCTPIKKVRCIAPTVNNPIPLKKYRDVSKADYKQHSHFVNDGNYGMAIYEGMDKRGNLKRDFVIINNLNAGKFFIGRSEEDPIPELHPKTKYPFKYLLKAGMMFLLYNESKDKLPFNNNEELGKRLYKLVKMDRNGRLFFRPHAEARPAGELKEEYNYDANRYIEQLCLRVSKFNALIEGIDFKISPIGKITKL